MSAIDIVLIITIVACAALAVRRIRKSGGSCGGQCSGCAHDCPHRKY